MDFIGLTKKRTILGGDWKGGKIVNVIVTKKIIR